MSKLTIVERGVEDLVGGGGLPMMLTNRASDCRGKTGALALEAGSVRSGFKWYRLGCDIEESMVDWIFEKEPKDLIDNVDNLCSRL